MKAILLVLLLSACSGKDDDVDSVAPESCLPTANAGVDAELILGNTATLNGTGSEGCEGGSTEYRWSFDAVPALSDITDDDLVDNRSATASQTQFTPDVAGVYVLSLIISDRGYDVVSTPDVVVITISSGDLAPVANCGGDLEGTVGNAANFDASSSYDPEAAELDYHWTLTSVPECSGLTANDLFNNGGDAATLVPDCIGLFTASLQVFDGGQLSEADFCTLAVDPANEMPIADAGVSRSVPYCNGSLIDLNGYGSYDPDGKTLTYQWGVVQIPKGSKAGDKDFDDPTLPNPQFSWDVAGLYRFQLQVHDGHVWSAPDIVDHVASDEANTAPIANAGGDFEIEVESTCSSSSSCPPCDVQVVLNATKSLDPDGDPLTYRWSSSDFSLDTPDSAHTIGTTTVSASYNTENVTILEATVEAEDCETSHTDTVEITVLCTGL